MKIFYPLAFLLLLGNTVVAQNWQCMQPGEKIYFTNSSGYLRGMRIDSTRTAGTVTTFYPFRSARGTYVDNRNQPLPLDINGGSWLGSAVVQNANGQTLFKNIWSDTLIINTQEGVGQTWTFYRDTTRVYYDATVLSVDTTRVDGVLDSVKRIGLQAKVGGLPVIDSINRFQILLSKNHGLLMVPDLIAFPYHEPGGVFNGQTPGKFDYYLELIRRSGVVDFVFTRLSFHNPAAGEIYNFQPGDIFQYSDYGGVFASTLIGTTTDSLISRTPIGTGIRYTLKKTTARPNPGMGTGFSYTYLFDTLFIPDIDQPLLDTVKMPEEWYNPATIYYWPQDTAYCHIGLTCRVDNVNIIADTRMVRTFEGSVVQQTYKSAFGVARSYNCLDPVQYCLDKHLTYTKKSGISCGRYQSLAVVNTKPTPAEFQVGPNPAHDRFFIKGHAGVLKQVSLCNMQGQMIREIQGKDQSLWMSVTDIMPGIYILHIKTEQGSESQRLQID